MEVVNDLEFDSKKENYCPRCYFETDKLLERGKCECNSPTKNDI